MKQSYLVSESESQFIKHLLHDFFAVGGKNGEALAFNDLPNLTVKRQSIGQFHKHRRIRHFFVFMSINLMA